MMTGRIGIILLMVMLVLVVPAHAVEVNDFSSPINAAKSFYMAMATGDAEIVRNTLSNYGAFGEFFDAKILLDVIAKQLEHLVLSAEWVRYDIRKWERMVGNFDYKVYYLNDITARVEGPLGAFFVSQEEGNWKVVMWFAPDGDSIFPMPD